MPTLITPVREVHTVILQYSTCT